MADDTVLVKSSRYQIFYATPAASSVGNESCYGILPQTQHANQEQRLQITDRPAQFLVLISSLCTLEPLSQDR